jgi:hypothetical protein
MLAGAEVGCRYRWPNDGCHPDGWLPPLKGVMLEQTDPRAWQGSLAFPCRDGLYEGVDAVLFIQWDTIDQLLPYADMVTEWQQARAEKQFAIEQQRREQIKEVRAEIRTTRAEMRERVLQPA